jgi:hypothetical protein
MGEDIRFRGRVRFWDEAAGKGLAVVDVPAELVERLGGRKQYRVAGTVNGAAYAGAGCSSPGAATASGSARRP